MIEFEIKERHLSFLEERIGEGEVEVKKDIEVYFPKNNVLIAYSPKEFLKQLLPREGEVVQPCFFEKDGTCILLGIKCENPTWHLIYNEYKCSYGLSTKEAIEIINNEKIKIKKTY